MTTPRNLLEWPILTLLVMKDMMPELAISSNQASIPREGLGQQLSHKPEIHNLPWLQNVQGKRWSNFGEKGQQMTGPTWDSCHEGSLLLTLLMIFCYTCQQEHRITVISSQTGPPEEGWEHQPTNKVFDPKLVQTKRNAGSRDWRNGLQVVSPFWDHVQAPVPYPINDAMLYLQKEPSIPTLWEALPSS